jgi:hypothetical protein
MACMTKLCDEPSLEELLGDPVTQAVMRADRVDPTKLEAMLRAIAREIADGCGVPTTVLVQAEGVRPGHNAVSRPWRPNGLLRDEAARCVTGSRIRSQLFGSP